MATLSWPPSRGSTSRAAVSTSMPSSICERFDKALAQQQQALFLAVGRKAVGAGFAQIPRGDQILRAALFGHHVAAGVVGLDGAEHKQRRAVFAARHAPLLSTWRTSERACS